ncbi:MAG: FHA domain-containing protein [Candidatus Korobacteraceae bacterium]|jgi:predicted component of type VI protein secretion system
MLVEIELVGQTNNWSYRKARIIIGRDSKCDVSLNEYPMVSREHAMLELSEDGRLTFSDRSANGTFVNGQRLATGIVHSGDTLRLGADGPELRLRLTHEPAKASATPGGAKTVIGEKESVATVLTEGPQSGATVLHHAESIAGKTASASASAPGAAGAATVRAASGAAAETRVHVVGGETAEWIAASPATADVKPVRVAFRESPKPEMPGNSMPSPARAAGLEVGDQQVMDKKLGSIRNLLAANLAVMVILLLAVLYQGQQINKNRDALTGMHEEAQNAVKTFTPALDQRLKVMEQRMDGFDGKMKQAEDRFVDRMDKELPSVMDKYINRKFEEIKRQTGK